MEIIKLNCNHSISLTNEIIATIGEFDGIHIAHQMLFKKTLELAKESNKKSAVITFDPHPDVILGKDKHVLLTSTDKINIIDKYGFDYLFIIEFDDNVLSMSHSDFVKKYLLKLNVIKLIVGFDFKYGYKGIGNCNTLESDSGDKISVVVIDEQIIGNNKIGSSLIKELLAKGFIKEANNLLGRYFKLSGYIIHGKNIGEKIKVPTANLKIEYNTVILKEGVYAGYCYVLGRKYNAICNIGHNPSFNYRNDLSYEIHILDNEFNDKIYDEFVELELVEYLREEVVFQNITEFQKQIVVDKKRAISILNNAL